MDPFTLQLNDGGVLTGRLSTPKRSVKNAPLLVCLHGGSYDANYFDMSPEYSISRVSDGFGIPVIALTRPGYGDSKLPSAFPAKAEDTYFYQQARYLNTICLPALWDQYGKQLGLSAVVLAGHSIGAAIATIMASLYTEKEEYPLAGLITSGTGAQPNTSTNHELGELAHGSSQHFTLDHEIKDKLMIEFPGENPTDPEVKFHTARLNKPVPMEEFRDIGLWIHSWHRYSRLVNVPLMYGIGEFDQFWLPTHAALGEYCAAFSYCPRIESEIVPMAPHCIELSWQGKGWFARCCRFAIECAGWFSSNQVLLQVQSL